MRKGAFLSSAALIAVLSASSGAWAQCTDNFNIAAFGPGTGGKFIGAANFAPLSSQLGSLTATINSMNTAFLTTTSAFVSSPANPRPDQLGGGAWGRAVVGSVDADTSSVATLDITKSLGGGLPGAGAFPVTGNQNCHTSIHQDYWGYQAGADFSILNHAGTGVNWHWGVTAGAMELKTKDTTPTATYTNPNFPGTILTSPQGDLSVSSQVPFVGIYTAYTKGGFFADAQLRLDFYQNTATEPNSGMPIPIAPPQLCEI